MWCIRQYWDAYYRRAEELAERFPENIRIFDAYEAIHTEAGQRAWLGFVGISPEEQKLILDGRLDPPSDHRRRPQSNNPMDPRRCLIMVPFVSAITPPCERAFEELERRGYPVRHVGGYSIITD